MDGQEGKVMPGARTPYIYGHGTDLNNNVTVSRIEYRDPISCQYVINVDLVIFQKQPADYRKYSWNVVFVHRCIPGGGAIEDTPLSFICNSS